MTWRAFTFPAVVVCALLPAASAQTPFLPFPPFELPNDPGSTAGIVTADFDRDGDLDLAVRSGNGIAPVVRAYENDGFGGFRSIPLTQASFRCFQLIAADLDGDGWSDLVASHPSSSLDGIAWWRNLRNGTFGPPAELAPGVWSVLRQPYSFAAGDVDNDGDLDLCVGGEERFVLRNEGGGSFAFLGMLPPGFANQEIVEIADYDRDGDQDILTFGMLFPSPFGFHVWRNDGAGRFTQGGFTATSNVFQAIRIDVDGDGDRDVVAAAAWSDRDVLLLDDGNGNFTDVSATHMPARTLRAWRLAGGDIDGDGDADLVVASENAESSLWYVNDGAGHFTMGGRAVAAGDSTWALALFDADGDDDLDLLEGNVFGVAPRLYRNVGRQQAAPTTVAIGRSMILDFHAFPFAAATGQLAVPAISFQIAPTALQLPGLGSLRLAPPIALLPAQVIVGTATTSLSIAVPNDVGLVGITAHVQSVFVASLAPLTAHLGNTTATTFVR